MSAPPGNRRRRLSSARVVTRDGGRYTRRPYDDRFPHTLQIEALGGPALETLLLHAGVGGGLPLLGGWDSFVVLLGLAVGAALYARGLLRSRGRRARLFPWWRPTLFSLGWLALVLSELPPIETLADDLFFVHMLQHMLILMVGAPLVLLGTPFVPFMRGLPARFRRRVAIPIVRNRQLRWLLRAVTHPVVALATLVIVGWGWHTPALYDLALEVEAAHFLEHGLFFWTAVIFWWSVIDPAPLRPRINYALRLPYLIAAVVQNIALGAFITFSTDVLYPSYESAPRVLDITVLEDQEIGGLMMWVGGSMMYLVALFIVLAVMLAREEEHTRRREALEAGLPPPGR